MRRAEAKHAAAIEKRNKQLADGGYSALIQAEKGLEAAEKEVAHLKLKLSGSEEALRLAQKNIQESDARAETAESEVQLLQSGLAAMHATLSDEYLLPLGISERALKKTGKLCDSTVCHCKPDYRDLVGRDGGMGTGKPEFVRAPHGIERRERARAVPGSVAARLLRRARTCRA